MKHLENKELNVDSLKEDQKEFLKNIKLIWKHNKDLKAKGIMFLFK